MVASKSFVHLHNHTEFSMLDGAAKLDELFARVQELGMPGVAQSDHGNLYGAFEFYKKARAAGINPIIGQESYLAPGSRFDKSVPRGDERKKTDKYSHMTMWAMTNEGFNNLTILSSKASLEGFYVNPRMDRELLQEYHKGIVATTGCVGGEVAQLIYRGQYEEAKRVAGEFAEIFGKGNFFVEIMRHNIEIERSTDAQLIQLAKELNLPLLATNDLHYTHKADAKAHDALLCIQTAANLSDQTRFKFESEEFYLKSAEEMRELFKDIPEACDNTLLINEMADVHLESGLRLLPEFPVPEHHDQESYLRERVQLGANRRYKNVIPEKVQSQIDYELDVINQMGFPAYFSIVEDLVSHAKEVGIRVGPGRGSAAGSMIAYCLGITELDPLEHGLVFERFLNPERVSMPDIDIDFDDRRRSEMITYSTEKYGEDHVAQIVTYGTIKAKAAIKDAARVLGMPYSVGDKLTKLMPPPVMGKDMPLKGCFDKNHARFKEAGELREAYNSDPDSKTVIDLALGLEGLKRQVGVHAAGVIISGDPLTDHVPIWRRPDDGAIVTQFDMRVCEEIGLLKMDFLGLRNLTIMSDALANIKKTRGEDLVLEDLPLYDEATYEMLRKGDSIGVFQLEGGPMRSLMRAIAPTSFADISALIALYRPGPMGVGAHIEYAERKNGRKPAEPIHPEFEESLAEILDETFGLCCYQEQVQRIAQKVAGYSLGQADLLRRAMGKKKKEILDKEYIPFSEGARKNGYSDEAIAKLWEVLVPFADYAFNKAHSAAYGVISYWTAYLKCHYPAEYLAAVLSSVKDDKDKTALYLNECRRLGIKVLSPDVNESDVDFTPVDGDIRFGLSAVRGVGEGVVEHIKAAREKKGHFKSFYDYAKWVDQAACNKRVLESLIKAGGFDSLGHKRMGLHLVYEDIVASSAKTKKNEAVGQFDLFSGMGMDTAPTVKIPEREWGQKAMLGFEREMLGLYVSAHPLDDIDLSHESPMPVAFLSDESIRDGDEVKIAGLLSTVEHRMSKAGKPWAVAQVEDKDGSVEVLFFGKTYTAYKDFLHNDEILVIAGKIDKSRDDSAKLIATGARNPLVAPEKRQELSYTTMVLVLEEERIGKDLAKEIKDTILANPGTVPVEAETPSGKRFPVHGVKCSDLYPARLQLSSIKGVKEILFL